VQLSFLSIVNNGTKSCQRRFPGETLPGRINPILLALLFCAGAAVAHDGYWINGSGGSWAGAGNWDSADGIAGGADNTAYFGFAREAAISRTQLLQSADRKPLATFASPLQAARPVGVLMPVPAGR